jgi:predicted metal-dependent phosphoesterase TrpH
MKDRVFFHKPNTDLFRSFGLTSIDMHYHSNYSDSYTRVSTIIKKARKLKMGVSITDHNDVRGNIEAAGMGTDVMVIPGIEVSSMQGPHLLFYFYSRDELTQFYEKHVKPYKQQNPYMAINRRVEELIESSKNYNCLRVAAHPYGYAVANSGLFKSISKKYVPDPVINDIDCMEVICGAMNRKLNRKALATARELNKGFTGGSDGHTIFELGKIVTSSYAEDVETFLNNILKKKNYVVGTEAHVQSRILPSTNLVTKHLRYALPAIKVQYQINKVRIASVKNRILEKGHSLFNSKD